jgi:hypothetical protein
MPEIAETAQSSKTFRPLELIDYFAFGPLLRAGLSMKPIPGKTGLIHDPDCPTRFWLRSCGREIEFNPAGLG